MEIAFYIPGIFFIALRVVGLVVTYWFAGWLFYKGVIKPLKSKLAARREAKRRAEERRVEESRREENLRLCEMEGHVDTSPMWRRQAARGGMIYDYRCIRCDAVVEEALPITEEAPITESWEETVKKMGLL